MSAKDAEAGKAKAGDTAHPGDSDESGTEVSDSSEPLFQFMTGIKDDLKARVPLYLDDWSKPKSIVTVVNATLYAFVIQLIPALIFAELMNRETEGNLATAEVLLSSAVIGIIYAIFAGQPLTIMGITGPVALLLGTSYGEFVSLSMVSVATSSPFLDVALMDASARPHIGILFPLLQV